MVDISSPEGWNIDDVFAEAARFYPDLIYEGWSGELGDNYFAVSIRGDDNHLVSFNRIVSPGYQCDSYTNYEHLNDSLIVPGFERNLICVRLGMCCYTQMEIINVDSEDVYGTLELYLSGMCG